MQRYLEVHHSGTSCLTTPKGSEFVKKFKRMQEQPAVQT